MMNIRTHKQTVPIFAIVGILAAITHLAVVYVLVNFFQISPIIANIAGFLVAFNISFYGHFHYTFAQRTTNHEKSTSTIQSVNYLKRQAVKRFFAIALVGFLINETCYALFLKYFGSQYYLPLLFTVLILVAGLTYLFSRSWAFKH